ncbi:MAG: hypothetical protein CW342_02770 [Thermoactinomycetaceae bacterium]|nr:hypothetical protein [Thermoactinomycetaceae bacterium]
MKCFSAIFLFLIIQDIVSVLVFLWINIQRNVYGVKRFHGLCYTLVEHAGKWRLSAKGRSFTRGERAPDRQPDVPFSFVSLDLF